MDIQEPKSVQFNRAQCGLECRRIQAPAKKQFFGSHPSRILWMKSGGERERVRDRGKWRIGKSITVPRMWWLYLVLLNQMNTHFHTLIYCLSRKNSYYSLGCLQLLSINCLKRIFKVIIYCFLGHLCVVFDLSFSVDKATSSGRMMIIIFYSLISSWETSGSFSFRLKEKILKLFLLFLAWKHIKIASDTRE